MDESMTKYYFHNSLIERSCKAMDNWSVASDGEVVLIAAVKMSSEMFNLL